MNILGAGNFGIVLKKYFCAVKLFYDTNNVEQVLSEVEMQKEAYDILFGIVKVPFIFNVMNTKVNIDGHSYLCGIQMEQVPFPETFTSPVHMVLGYYENDVDSLWGRTMSEPVGPHNPPRGFHAGQEMMEAIWEDEGSSMTIEYAAYEMGRSMSALIQRGFHPFDAEFLYGGGEIWMIDFGLCRKTTMSREQFFKNKSSDGLFTSYYIPKSGMRGYESFCKGYWF